MVASRVLGFNGGSLGFHALITKLIGNRSDLGFEELIKKKM